MSASVGSEGADPNLTPLLDLVLQLIMFFMITVNFVRVDQFDDAIKLPVATTAVAMDSSAEDWVFLNLDASGKLVGTLSTFALDTPEKIKVHLMQEKAGLERSAKARGKNGEVKVFIILRADKTCKYGDIWKVLDSCQRAGFKYWQLRAMTSQASLRMPQRELWAMQAPVRQPRCCAGHAIQPERNRQARSTMKKKTGIAAPGVNLGLIITPMLDMSFQILAFFIMSYHPSALEGHLSGILASPPANSSHGGVDPADPIVNLGEVNDAAVTVVIKSAGEMPGKPGKVLLRRTVEPVPAQIADATETWVQARRLLDRELKRLRKDADTEQSSIRIEADAELRQEFVVDVYDVCKNAGFSKILFVPPPR